MRSRKTVRSVARHLLQRAAYIVGRHRRSTEAARKSRGVWRSVCRGCGVAMLREGKGDWKVAPPRTASRQH